MPDDPGVKKVNFELIRRELDPEPYRLMDELRRKYHRDIEEARIALAWRKALKPDIDGHLVLGKCVKASDLQRELAEWDFVILLNQEVWSAPEFDDARRRALLDHELCHAQVSVDESGEERVDERGRKVWRTCKHDVEEFQAVIERHGCYKGELEKFAEALLKAKQAGPQLPFDGAHPSDRTAAKHLDTRCTK
jgi:hypothetical protein